jgi:hypothetical protein
MANPVNACSAFQTPDMNVTKKKTICMRRCIATLQIGGEESYVLGTSVRHHCTHFGMHLTYLITITSSNYLACPRYCEEQYAFSLGLH